MPLFAIDWSQIWIHKWFYVFVFLPITTKFNRGFPPCLFSSSALISIDCRAFPKERLGVGTEKASSPFDPLDAVSGRLDGVTDGVVDGVVVAPSGLRPRRPEAAATPFSPVLRREPGWVLSRRNTTPLCTDDTRASTRLPKSFVPRSQEICISGLGRSHTIKSSIWQRWHDLQWKWPKACQVPGNIKAHGLLLARDGHAGHFGDHFRVQFIVSRVSAFSYGQERNTTVHLFTKQGHHDEALQTIPKKWGTHVMCVPI